MTMLDDMKADTSIILDDWGESLSIDRSVNTYIRGMASQSWSDRGTVVGDWQPVSGSTVRAEEGRAVKSDAQVIVLVDSDIKEGDRVYRPDGSFMYVNYIKKYEDHWMVMLTRAEPK